MLCMFCIAYFGVPVSKMRFHKKTSIWFPVGEGEKSNIDSAFDGD